MHHQQPTKQFESFDDVLDTARATYESLPDDAFEEDLEGMPPNYLVDGKYIDEMRSLIFQLIGHGLPALLLFGGCVARRIHTDTGLIMIVLGVLLWPIGAWLEKRAKRRTVAWRRDLTLQIGALIQANGVMYEEGEVDMAPGAMLVTFDPELERDPARMLELASVLFNAQEDPSKHDDPAVKQLLINSEEVNWRRGKVDPALCGNDRTYVVDLVFHRNALPHRVVDRRIWFVLGHEHANESVVMPHKDLWWNESVDALAMPSDRG